MSDKIQLLLCAFYGRHASLRKEQRSKTTISVLRDGRVCLETRCWLPTARNNDQVSCAWREPLSGRPHTSRPGLVPFHPFVLTSFDTPIFPFGIPEVSSEAIRAIN